ncbi:MAG: heavy metal translocating P-type ATPase [bacterium]
MTILKSMPELTKKEKKELRRILMAAALLVVTLLLPIEGLWRLPIFLVPYLIVGGSVLLRAGKNIRKGQVFDENFLMALATVGAFCIGEYPEAVFVMLFYQVGELFEHIAVGHSRRSIASLMDIRPDTANWERDGAVTEADPEEIPVGSVIVVRPGERVPLDGVVLEGSSSLDTMALTGESLPRDIAPGESIVSGCVNLTGTLRVETTRAYGESTVSKILDLVENSASRKAKSEDFITRFARWYTPAVVIAALLVAIVPPLFDGAWVRWIHQALMFLVISCPCALVLSVPLSYFGGIGGASRCGILVKGSNYLEALASAETFVFDKTGTLTRGAFSVTQIAPSGNTTEAALLETAALAERDSTHPIALSIRAAWGGEAERSRVSEVREEAGHGVSALVDGRRVLAGNAKLLTAHGIAAPAVESAGTVVHVAADGKYLGYLLVSDTPKPEAKEALAGLRAHGLKTLMLTGDRRAAAEAVAKELGIDEVRAELLPGDKVAAVEEAIRRSSAKGKVVFVGDGVNDAPVLARADLGVAMGVMGSDAAIEAADIVLMDDDLRKLEKAVALSRRTNRIVWENIAFALAVKAAVLILGLLGAAQMSAAIFADVGVLILAVLNAMRTLRK